MAKVEYAPLVPTTKRNFGNYTNVANLVGTGTGEQSIWDFAYGTKADRVGAVLSGESNNVYWGSTQGEYTSSVRDEGVVADRVMHQSAARTHGYLKNIDTGEIRRFQFNPETFQYTRGATYSETSCPGSAYPSTQFVKGNAREFTVELYMRDRLIEPTTTLKDYISFFGSFLTPEQNVEGWKRPPQMLFFYGYWVRKCVMTNLDITIDQMDENGTPTEAHISLTLRQIGVV